MAPDTRENLVHVVLGHSYLFYFLGIIIGAGLHAIWGYQLMTVPLADTGMTVIIFGTMITLWAQNTSRQTHGIKQGKDIAHDDFYRGPYRFTRSPTHFGLGLVSIGLAFVFNSLSMTVVTVLTFFITRYIFIRKEETLLEGKYGESYRAYTRRVRF